VFYVGFFKFLKRDKKKEAELENLDMPPPPPDQGESGIDLPELPEMPEFEGSVSDVESTHPRMPVQEFPNEEHIFKPMEIPPAFDSPMPKVQRTSYESTQKKAIKPEIRQPKKLENEYGEVLTRKVQVHFR
jgi:hypothetical protein